MKSFVFVTLFLSAISVFGQEQSSSAFRKYPVGATGCSAYLPETPGDWTVEKSEDGSDVYTLTQVWQGLSLDLIVVQFNVPLSDVPNEELEALLISYLDYLKDSFSITESVGYGKGQLLPGDETAIGVLDFWKDSGGAHSKVKGWINETNLAVLLVTSDTDPSEEGITDLFLNGFRFPEKQ